MTLLEIYNKAELTAQEIKQVSAWIAPGCNDEFYEFYDSPAFNKLYEYFAFVVCEMPYGVAKARTDTPDEWILNHLSILSEQELRGVDGSR